MLQEVVQEVIIIRSVYYLPRARPEPAGAWRPQALGDERGARPGAAVQVGEVHALGPHRRLPAELPRRAPVARVRRLAVVRGVQRVHAVVALPAVVPVEVPLQVGGR